ncbi:MAG: class I SAM-dependent DNA methyltransferase [Betaproteobacteria bacterium]|nr:class I SAM-dependent DNA methyltransferase [Betaproteobacteria bacterium]
MQLSWEMIQANALSFSRRWKDGHDEKSEGQSFVRDFLAVFGVKDAAAMGRFEERAKRESGRGFMDYFWPQRIAIEMKSRGKNLEEAWEQVKDYVFHLPANEIPDLVMVCDFEHIVLYQRNTSGKKQFKIKDLHRHVRKFANIAGYESTREIEDQLEVNVTAAEKMAKLHDALKSSGYEGHDLEVYLVRLLFCLFADDTGIFPQQAFLNYVENSKKDGSDLSERIGKLFEVLNWPDETRAKRTLLSLDLKQFRYINGRLFKDLLPSADFDAKMRATLLECCHFDWGKISPAIFGAMFQGVMDKEERRELGAHYTSEENILKLINPLFMDELWAELEQVKTNQKQLEQFHNKISRLKFLDPACGCGNFLIITYRELRRLELEVLKMKIKSSHQKVLDIESMLKASVAQFYGIEIEDFPCQVAMVGMWLIDHQMNLRVSEEFGAYYTRLPLRESATIVRENALRIDWESVVAKEELRFILGNPPFVGKKEQTLRQREDMQIVFGDLKGRGRLDYVSAWYKKATDIMNGTTIKTAFVSTNSITQGEQVPILWKPLMERGIFINFGVPTFKWSNEAKGKAAVHCVIVGFGFLKTEPNINPYLTEAPTVFVESRAMPICAVPEIVTGNQATDGGYFYFDQTEYDDFLSREHLAGRYIRRAYGGEDFIKNKPRYCLWLIDIDPKTLKQMPLVLERIAKVRKFRLASAKKATRQWADMPAIFTENRQPDTNFIVIPKVSSENRRYIPIGFLSPDVICNNTLKIIPNATLYHFGILSSNVHNAWMRTVGGRMKSDYQYSNNMVYNNFPWPDATEDQKAAIEKLAEAVLDARALFPDSSLADLYDTLTMPPELFKAHHALDHVVMKLYGFAKDIPEPAIVAALMERYQQLTTQQQTFDKAFSEAPQKPKRPNKEHARAVSV